MDTHSVHIEHPEEIREKIICYADMHDTALVCDSPQNDSIKSAFKRDYLVAAIGVTNECLSHDFSWNQIDRFLSNAKRDSNWVFGFLSYDLKNEIEQLTSSGTDSINFPGFYFFIPEMNAVYLYAYLTVFLMNLLQVQYLLQKIYMLF